MGGAGAGGRQQQQQQQQQPRRRRGGRGGGRGSKTATPQLKYDKELLSYTQSYGFPGWVGTEGSAGRADGARPRCERATSATVYAIAGAVGLYAALSGAGALYQCAPRLGLYGYAGFDLVLRDARALLLGEDGGGVVAEDMQQHYGIMHYPSRGRRTPAERRARAGAAEHAANVCHDIAVVRRAAVASRSGGGNRRRGGRGGGGQDEDSLNFWLYSLWRPTTRRRCGAGPGGRGLSGAALAFVVEQHLLDPATDPFGVGTWASILGEALALALHAVDGDAAALVGAGGLYPSLAFGSPLWPKLLGGLGKLGRCLCFGLLGQREGANGEVLTQREEVLFENLLDAALRLLVPLGEGMAADAGVAAGDGAAAVRKLTEPYLAPVWRLMEDALGSMEGMVEEPTRFAGASR